ncbi:MAG: hypothetical protein SPK34_11125 [Bacteroidaceae bacterium]|jgi:hypothetical protein|nr:hypothetical protein [Prevotellaceae bacterium]MDY5761458.1 hypothetical protein [Bacteroidaceae bacterium]
MERLLNILTNPDKRRIWILNRKYCPNMAMIEGKAEVLYSYDPVGQETPFSYDAIRNIEFYNYKTFVQAYKDERREILDYDAPELRIMAVWSFYKNVHKDDVLLFVHGSEIEGYYVVTGEHVECRNEEDFSLHSWEAETIRFSRPVCIASRFGSPFFKIIGDFKREVVAALKKALQS